MRAGTRLIRLGIVGAVAALVGCQARLEPTTNDEPAFTFPDDEDPALAALPFVETELLVQPYPGAEAEALDALFSQVGANVVEESEEIQLTVLEVAPGRLHGAAAELAASGLIDTLQKNYLFEAVAVPNDPMYSQQQHLPQINAPQAWDVIGSSDQIIIAIIDTGVDGNHPDLAGKLLNGRNIVDRNNLYEDVEGHGTMVAGVAAAASNNGLGVAGVAWDSPILPVRVADDEGFASASDLATGIIWAVKRGARVINVSFAPLWSNGVVRSGVRYAYRHGSLVVISSGNDGLRASSAGFDEALFVGAITDSDQIASFSNRGPFVDLVAPGTGITTTGLGGGYSIADGTSFSAPIVAGVAALEWSRDPSMRPTAVKQALLDSTADLGRFGKDDTFGHGGVDAFATVSRPIPAPQGLDTTAPVVQIQRLWDGASLAGLAIASVTAHDAEGVDEVTLSIDGVAVATDRDQPYNFLIDTARFSSGRHEILFAASDVAGNRSAVETVDVSFESASIATADTAADISFEQPAPAASVTGDVLIQATVEDSDGLASVEWLVDGAPMLTSPVMGTSSGVSFLWRTAQVPSGSHTITIVVTDLSGQQTTGRLVLVKP